MASLLRTARLSRPLLTHAPRRRYAQESYGGYEQSGHPKSSAPNPKSHVEHPGPEAPASKGNKSSKTASSSSDTSSEEGKSSDYPETSKGGKPAIHNPGAAPEKANEEVREHNEEVEKRHDKAANKIDKDGDVKETS